LIVPRCCTAWLRIQHPIDPTLVGKLSGFPVD
jgi:hypothetical protein